MSLIKKTDLKEKIKNYLSLKKEKSKIDLAGIDFSVELKPIFNIQPKIYLTAFSSLILISLLFLLLFLPGIKNYGTTCIVTSTPTNSALFVDGEYKATTPCKIFVKKGIHNFSIQYSGAAINNIEIKIKGRIFATLIIPNRKKISLSTTTEDLFLCASDSLNQFKTASCFHVFEAGTLPPPIITLAVNRLLTSSDFESAKAKANELISQALFLANSLPLKNDCFEALKILCSKELEVSSAKVNESELYLEVAKKLILFSNKMPSLFFDYYTYFPSQNRKEIKNSDFFKSYNEKLIKYCSIPSTADFGKKTGRTISIDGVVFHEFKGGYSRVANAITKEVLTKLLENQRPLNIPILYHSPNFYLSEKPIPASLYKKFTNANPNFEKKLRSQNLVNRFYEPNSDNSPIVNISYHAAREFLTAKNMRLPHVVQLINIDKNFFSTDTIFSSATGSEVNLNSLCEGGYANGYFIDEDFLVEQPIFCFAKNKQYNTSSFPSNFCASSTTAYAVLKSNKVTQVELNANLNEIF